VKRMSETLGFEQAKQWFRAHVGRPVSIQISTGSQTVAFLDGSIDGVMGFAGTDSHGLLIEGGSGAWLLQLAEPDFRSATLTAIPDSFTVKQLTITMRNHQVTIRPGMEPRPEE
jgi:hypothetical protein